MSKRSMQGSIADVLLYILLIGAAAQRRTRFGRFVHRLLRSALTAGV
ncbi:hypothetical protein SAMN04487938_2834 [Lysobacter sp. cf310]|nr:hypothetical protein SAMN04487938_2834 [Lysobacter sp. cf310]